MLLKKETLVDLAALDGRRAARDANCTRRECCGAKEALIN
jgi:hypothetical protein